MTRNTRATAVLRQAALYTNTRYEHRCRRHTGQKSTNIIYAVATAADGRETQGNETSYLGVFDNGNPVRKLAHLAARGKDVLSSPVGEVNLLFARLVVLLHLESNAPTRTHGTTHARMQACKQARESVERKG